LLPLRRLRADGIAAIDVPTLPASDRADSAHLPVQRPFADAQGILSQDPRHRYVNPKSGTNTWTKAWATDHQLMTPASAHPAGDTNPDR
jgi:hypothetical protein